MAHGDSTRSVHAGQPEPVPGTPFLAGPVLGAPYHLDPEVGPRPGLDGYGRTDNASFRHLESAIAELEGAPGCVAFSSGMAAVTAVLFSTLGSGDTVVLPADGYYKTRVVAAQRLGA
jgi:cystathionine gamma-lyase